LVEWVGDVAAHPDVAHRLHAGLEPVEADAEGDAPDVLVPRVVDLAPADRRHRALVQLAAVEVTAHHVAELPGEDAIHDPGEPRRTLEVVAICRQYDLIPADRK